MKLRRIKWANHPILGNLEIDFVNPETQQPYSTIIFAGENGTGKTTILETISNFLCIGSFNPFDFIEYEVNDNVYRAVPLNNNNIDSFFKRVDVVSGAATDIRSNKNNNPNNIRLRDIA